LINGVLTDGAVEAAVLEAQDAALARLRGQDFSGTLLRFVDGIFSLPKRAPAAVAYDFWRQFALADELERIRQHRPAAFRALPLSPEDGLSVADLGHRA